MINYDVRTFSTDELRAMAKDASVLVGNKYRDALMYSADEIDNLREGRCDGDKLKVELSWDDSNYCCMFKRGDETEDWIDLTLDEQKYAIGAMTTIADMFGKFLKQEDAK